MTITTKYNIGSKVFVLFNPTYGSEGSRQEHIKEVEISYIGIDVSSEGTNLKYHMKNHPLIYGEKQCFETTKELIDFLKGNIQYCDLRTA